MTISQCSGCGYKCITRHDNTQTFQCVECGRKCILILPKDQNPAFCPIQGDAEWEELSDNS